MPMIEAKNWAEAKAIGAQKGLAVQRISNDCTEAILRYVSALNKEPDFVLDALLIDCWDLGWESKDPQDMIDYVDWLVSSGHAIWH